MWARVKRISETILYGIMVLALSVLALSVLTQVIMRYVLSAPPFWTEELARFVLIWLTFVGIAAVQISRDQIGIDWVSGLLPETGQRILRAMNSLIVFVILVAIIWAGYTIAALGSQTSPALGISMRFIYGALPIGAAATLLVVAAQLVEEIAAIFPGSATNDD